MGHTLRPGSLGLQVGFYDPRLLLGSLGCLESHTSQAQTVRATASHPSLKGWILLTSSAAYISFWLHELIDDVVEGIMGFNL